MMGEGHREWGHSVDGDVLSSVEFVRDRNLNFLPDSVINNCQTVS